jgi:hypothetical protein
MKKSTSYVQTPIKPTDIIEIPYKLRIPPNSNLRTILKLTCNDDLTNEEICSFRSATITLGRNVEASIINQTYTVRVFYSNIASIDLGIVTNTGYYHNIIVN